MHNFDSLDDIVLGAWFVFLLYWFISATNVKRDVGSETGLHGRSFAFVRIVISVALASMFPTVVTRLLGNSPGSPEDLDLRYTGAAVTLAGVLFAIWARYHLGRNWSGHPALKEDHELVMTGPYRFLRHPIYSGMLMASFGSMFASFQAFWLYFFVLMSITFIYRIHTEERIMLRTFPNDYPAYRERTNALIPFIW